MQLRTIARSLALLVLTAAVAASTALAAPGKSHSLSPHLKDAVDLGRAPASERHRVVVSLDVRDRDGLEAFLADVQSEQHHRVASVEPAAAPRAALGSNCCHLSPNDVLAFYDNTAAASGAGQTIVIAGAYAWRDTDTTAFNSQWGLPQLPVGSAQVCTGPSGSSGCTFSSQNSIEIALDVEYAHGTAPAARILNYMAASPSDGSFTTMYNRIVTDNPGHVVSTSWGACEVGLSAASQRTNDNIFANANAIGQSWFAASGDSGSRDCSNVLGVDHPANS